MGMRTKKTKGKKITSPSKQTTRYKKSKGIDLSRVAVIDLFCGAGGLAHGFVLEGFCVVAGIDADPACRYPFETNNSSKFINRKIEDILPADLEMRYDGASIKILAGCAPCQPFSTYYRKDDRDKDQRWELIRDFYRLVREVKPHIITMENVPRLRAHWIFKEIKTDLISLGYNVFEKIVFCPDYGIPQSRRRLVILGSLLGPISLLPGNLVNMKQATVRRAIGDYRLLEPIKAGEQSKKDPMHKARALSELNLLRIKASKPGGTWKSWDEELVANCHKIDSGGTYRSVYGRMEWDKPSPTITTQFYGFGNGRFGHPEQDRAISIREAAILQTFPFNYQFVPRNETTNFEKLGRLIGNAVPVELGRAIAKSIKIHLENNNG
jgi:DNA (cytosine-5)-methyltransferase 1